MPVGIANIDCEANHDLCREQEIMAFPTLRWYENKEAQSDYKSDRTVKAFIAYVKRKLELNDKFKDWDKKGENKNPGCEVSGTLWGKIKSSVLYDR